MSTPDVSAADLALVVGFVAALLLPGGVLGVVAGLRGWTLLAVAPLLTYAVTGLTGPWTTALGLSWSAPVMIGATLVLAVVLAAVRAGAARYARGRDPLPGRAQPSDQAPGVPRWSTAADVALALALLGATVLGAAAVLRGIRRLGAVPQDWDAVFHAAGIRWIADTGDAGVFGMSQVNWYEPGVRVFYPNAYHSLGAVVYQLSGAELPAVLNAHTVLIPGLAATVLAVLVRRFGGSLVHAVGTALAAVAVTALYDLLWRGPLLPFATGVVLTPVIVVVLVDFLDAHGVADRVRTGAVVALCAAGLLCLHPAMLFGAAVFTVAFLLARWIRDPTALRAELPGLLAAGAAGLVLCATQVSGSLYSAASFPAVDWPADLTWSGATLRLLAFGHGSSTFQVWLVVAAVAGLATVNRMRGLRWTVGAALVFGMLFVLAAASDAAWVNALTRPWWNDRWRLAGLFALTMSVLVGHGVAQVHQVGMWLLRRAGGDAPLRVADRRAVAVVAVVLFVALTNGLYLARNGARMALNTGEGPAVSSDEVAALRALDTVVPNGVRVLNDRGDGSVWMYPLSGTHPVAGHYDATGLQGTDADLLAQRFNRFVDDPEVRAAVGRLDVGYVLVADGFLRGDQQRAPGLVGLADAPFLRAVYRNPDVVVYEIVWPTPAIVTTSG